LLTPKVFAAPDTAIDSVEIRIQSSYDRLLLARSAKYLVVTGPRHPNLPQLGYGSNTSGTLQLGGVCFRSGILKVCSRERQRLPHILNFQLRKVPKQIFTVGKQRNSFHHAANRQPLSRMQGCPFI